jgi:hypothetical protein
LPNEFLQVKEFAVDQIVNKFAKIIDAPAFSLSGIYYLGQQLSDELPADLLSASLVWVRCGRVIPPLQRPYDGSYLLLCHLHQPSSPAWMIQPS